MKAVIQLSARVLQVRRAPAGETVGYGAGHTLTRPSILATVAIGYADGYRRAFGNHASAIVRGTRVRVVGMVSMDMTMLDVTEVDCAIGDAATLIGAEGGDAIDVMEIAATADMSPYELLTGLRARLARRYINHKS